MSKAKTQQKERSPVYVIFGADAFLRAQALSALLNRLLPDDGGDTAPSSFDGDNVALADVLDECRTPSLLASTRVVLVRDADPFVTRFRAELENYLDSPSPDGILILECRTWQKTTRLYKKVDALGGNIACEPPKRHELPAWLIQRAADEHACRLPRDVADRLIELVGDNLGLLNMELAKLATYVGAGQPIRIEHVEDLVGCTRQEIIFRVFDAIADRDAATALARWDQVISTDRSAPYRAVGGLAWSMRRFAEAKRLAGVNRSPYAAGFRDTEAQILNKALDRYSLSQWYDNLIKLLRIDLGAKTGLGNVETAVEKLIVEMCSAR